VNPLELPRDDSREFFDYWLALRAGWRLLAGCALTAALVTFVITEFMMTPYYRATALLRPVAEQSSASQLQGMLTGSAGALSGMLGGLTEEAQRAQEYLAILRSYQFTLALVNDNGLAAAVDPPGGSVLDRFLGSAPPTQWQLYEIMQKRFDCDYDRLSGNLSLYFLDPDPARARRILQLYIENLRSKLQSDDVRRSDAAISSLTEAARSSSDTLLQAQLYELLARQIQQKKLAQVSADFALKVIDPPVVPDRPYTPRVKLDCALAAGLALLLVTFVILVHDSSVHTGSSPERAVGPSQKKLPMEGEADGPPRALRLGQARRVDEERS